MPGERVVRRLAGDSRQQILPGAALPALDQACLQCGQGLIERQGNIVGADRVGEYLRRDCGGGAHLHPAKFIRLPSGFAAIDIVPSHFAPLNEGQAALGQHFGEHGGQVVVRYEINFFITIKKIRRQNHAQFRHHAGHAVQRCAGVVDAAAPRLGHDGFLGPELAIHRQLQLKTRVFCLVYTAREAFPAVMPGCIDGA